jgi:acetyl esterase/lipase
MQYSVLSSGMALVTLVGILTPTVGFGQGQIVVEQDVVYGRTAGSALVADIAYPVSEAPVPAMIYVHGGRWRAGERTGRDRLDVYEWAGEGFFSMTIDYRLVPASPAPAPYQDLLCAIRWVHAHAEEYGIDPDRVYLIGNSAGGHLVSLVATLGDGPYEKVGGWENARSDVRAVISAAAPYELNALSWGNLWTPIEGNVEEQRRIASPIRQINASTKPILIIHSDDDRSVPVQQAHDMVAAMDNARAPHKFVHHTDRGHMRITEEVTRATLAFIADLERP